MIHKIKRHLIAYRAEKAARQCDRRLARILNEILRCDLNQLKDARHVETLIRRVGLVRDTRNLYGEDERFMNPIPRGLWQIPRQLAEFSVFLSSHRIQSFIEIGTFAGYTFSFLTAYLSRFNPGMKSVTVDICDGRPVTLAKTAPFNARFVIGTSGDFQGQRFDLCLIDGDHSFAAVGLDFENIGRHCGICAFHDVNDVIVEEYPGNAGGVPRFWNQLKRDHPHQEFHEFTSHSHDRRVMGIGVMLNSASVASSGQ